MAFLRWEEPELVLRFVMAGGGQGEDMKDPQANQKQVQQDSATLWGDLVSPSEW